MNNHGKNDLAMDQKRFKQLQRRVYILEQAMEALLESDGEYLEKFPAFNDQQFRKDLFLDLFSRLSPRLIIETGTKWGNTTAYIAKHTDGVPIVTSELVRESYLIARERLKHFPAAKVVNSDSRTMLRNLVADDCDTDSTALFYLDAHWYEDLPLLEEVEIIATNWQRFVLLIDDFKVPGDAGYLYDDYGEEKCLHLPYLRPAITKHNLSVFFPTTPSSVETGKKRGCAIICNSGSESSALSESPHLRIFKI